MRIIRIDLHPRRPAWSGWMLLAASLALATYLAHDYLGMQVELADWRAKSERLGRRSPTDALATPKAQTEALKGKLKYANKVMAGLALPWQSLFTAIEGIQAPDVVLLSLEPDVERGEARITAEAKDVAAMLDYLKSVQQSGSLADAYVVSHQVQAQDAQKPVRFAIAATWRFKDKVPLLAHASEEAQR